MEMILFFYFNKMNEIISQLDNKNTYHMLFLIKQLYLPKDLIEYILGFTSYNQQFYSNHKLRLYCNLGKNKYELNKECMHYYWNKKRYKLWINHDHY
jgi:hypothetical protein